MGDELGRLRRFSTIRSSKNIRFLTPAVYSGGWCPMRVACNICEDIEGMSYLLVGMPECATYSRRVRTLPEGKNGELHWLYVLDANEVVFGCKKGLTDALIEMDRNGARAILLIATCVTELIGEDLEGILDELRPVLNTRLAFITLGQFKNFAGGIGTWKTAEALGQLMQRRDTAAGRVNALFVEPWRNINDPVKLPLIVLELERLGVSVRKVIAGATLDDYMEAPDASLNLALSSYTQPLAANMEASFGIPYAPLHSAFSVEAIDGVYTMIEKACGIVPSVMSDNKNAPGGESGDIGVHSGSCGNSNDAYSGLRGAFSGLRTEALALEARARAELGGLRFAMLPGVDMPAALAAYLGGFGMEPVILHIDDLHAEDIGYAKQLKAMGYDPRVCRMMNIDRDVEVVHRSGVDISFGGKPDGAPEDFRCSEEMGDFFGMAGYERTSGILSRIFKVLETGGTR